MLKKSKLLFVIMLLVISLAGCQIVDVAKDIISDELSGEELYRNLDSLISSPATSSSYQNLPRKFDFTAVILSEPYTMEVENKDGVYEEGKYISAGISRNMNDYFILNITDMDYNFNIYDIVTVTTDSFSSIYWTEESKREEVAEFKALNMKLYDGEIKESVTGDTVTVDNNIFKGELTFKKAEKSEDILGDATLLYFDFKNTDDRDSTPSLSSFGLYQGDSTLKTSMTSTSPDVDPAALKLFTGNNTYAGKTQYYYTVLKNEVVEGIEFDNSAPLIIELYDDNFNIVYSYEMNVE